MKKDKTLLIMAAGMGSRFGGLKQIEPVGPNGEFIIDYSIYDAIRFGFNKVVFVIKEENYDLFKETIGNRVSKHIEVEYAFQNIEDVPEGYDFPKSRVKPWGTVHAVLSAKDKISTPFAVINSDNFYGKESIETLSEMLDKVTDNEYGLVAYYLRNTLSENGAVKRGVCRLDDNDYLTELIESRVEVNKNKMYATPLSGDEAFVASKDELVSVNLFAFAPKLFDYLTDEFKKFMEINKDDLEICESIITETLQNLIEEDKIKIKVDKTDLPFLEITYKSDLDKLKNTILKKIEDGDYPDKLWD